MPTEFDRAEAGIRLSKGDNISAHDMVYLMVENYKRRYGYDTAKRIEKAIHWDLQDFINKNPDILK